jgi:hypothetical protein
MKKNNTLLPLKAAARVLGVRPDSLRSEADAGRVPFTKIGDEYLFLLSALEAVLVQRAKRRAVRDDN